MGQASSQSRKTDLPFGCRTSIECARAARLRSCVAEAPPQDAAQQVAAFTELATCWATSTPIKVALLNLNARFLVFLSLASVVAQLLLLLRVKSAPTFLAARTRVPFRNLAVVKTAAATRADEARVTNLFDAKGRFSLSNEAAA